MDIAGNIGALRREKRWTQVQIAKKTGDREKCLSALREFDVLAAGVPSAAASPDFHISQRNPLYFSHVTEEEAREEYFSSVVPEKLYEAFDAFFGEDGKWKEFRNVAARSDPA